MSTIAKLLATENITVVEGNYSTASFDLKSRTMCLPAWAESKALKDLMTGHEVGHALFTPEEGWHDAIKRETAEAKRLPASLLNIVEDVRIERAIQAKYPGLVLSFLKGYKELFERDFFGTKDRPYETFNFIDRINIKSKLRELADVPFSDEEQTLYDKVQGCQTWEDVVAVCEEIVAFVEDQKQEEEQDEDDSNANATDGSGEENSEEGQESDQPEDSSDGSSGAGEDSEESEKDEDTGESSSTESQSESADEPTDDGSQSPSQDQLTSETDDAYRENESTLAPNIEQQPVTVHALTPRQIEESTQTMADAEEQLEQFIKEYSETEIHREWVSKLLVTAEDELNTFIKESKPAVNVMIQEFNIRKNASRHARASESKKGSLNTQKLHSYKYNDDIFKRVTNLADAKNHGIVMFIDASGSMANTIGDVVRQVIQLHLFCTAVGVPYEAYTFTTSHRRDRRIDDIPVEGFVSHSNFRLTKVLSSDMKKTEARRAMEILWLAYASTTGQLQLPLPAMELGATPLVPTLLAAHTIVPQFKARHNVEKMNTIILSDGEPTQFFTGNLSDCFYQRRRHGVEYRIGNKKVYAPDMHVKSVVALQESLKEHCGTDVISFFIADGTSEAMSYLSRRNGYGCEETQYLRKAFRKGQPIVFDTIKGSDQTIIIKSGNFKGTDDEFEVNEGISKQQMTKQFKKFMNSKKVNRIVFSKLAKKIAEAA